MKRFICVLAALALSLCLAAPVAAADAQSAGLKFKQDGTFKIIQVADAQEFILSSSITQEFLYEVAAAEKPDLFVLTGDNIDIGAKRVAPFPAAIGKRLIKSSVDTLMCVFDRIYKDFGIPVTMAYGNHDNECPDTLTRAEQFAMYAAHPGFIGYYIPQADEGTLDSHGQRYGTHNLIIKDKTGTTPKFNIWMFDSGANPGGVQKPQIDWFTQANNDLTQANGGLPLPSFAFQHHPVPEVYDCLTPEQTLPPGTIGEMRQLPSRGESHGQYEALDSAGNVLALFFGHNHRNSYELHRAGRTDLVNTPLAGFGPTTGDHDLRGVRVITLSEGSPAAYETRLVTYQKFYPDNFLRRGRAGMFTALRTWGMLFDWMSFKPLLWFLGLFYKI